MLVYPSILLNRYPATTLLVILFLETYFNFILAISPRYFIPYLIPLLFCTFKNNSFQLPATLKCMLAYAGYTARNCYACELMAILERSIAYACYTIRYCNVFKAYTGFERIIAYAC